MLVWRPATLTAGLKITAPINDLWRVAKQTFGSPLDVQLRVILSLGIREPPLKPLDRKAKDLGKSIIAIAGGTQQTHVVFCTAHSQDVLKKCLYFRFNPPDLRGEVELDDHNNTETMVGKVDVYSARYETQQAYQKFARTPAGNLDTDTQSQPT